MPKKSPIDVYQVVTDRIIEQLENGTVPWHKPWTGGRNQAPRNLASGSSYRGINVFLLMMAGFSNPYWLTYRQATAMGGSVKSGSKGFPVIFFKFFDKVSGEGKDTNKFPVLRYYTVFNIDQCEGITIPDDHVTPRTPIEAITECEEIISCMPLRPVIEHSANGAFYRPALDIVNMPPKANFSVSEEYYSTLFHELSHATGSASRLNRPGITDSTSFGSDLYSKEELIAEMAATFLCGITGIENKTITNSAAYINSWLQRLKNDRKLLVSAGQAAQKAVDFITNAQVGCVPEVIPEVEHAA